MQQPKQDYTSPIHKIRESYSSLSPIQKRIADLILGQAETVCFMRLEDISKQVGVTSVTVIRFVKKIGYESFGAFKKELQNYVQSMVLPKQIVKPEVSDLRSAPADDIIRQAIQSEIDLTQATYRSNPPETLLEVTELIKNARKIFIVGTGLNEPVTEILLTRLKFLCLDAQIIYSHNSVLPYYYLLGAGPDDVFIIFSFPNYKEFSIRLAKCAQNLGCHTICITDTPTAPIAYYAEKLLLCQTSSLVFYNSMTAPTSLVTILTSILATQIPRDAKTQERLDHIESFFNT